jgi:hypothetical protein
MTAAFMIKSPLKIFAWFKVILTSGFSWQLQHFFLSLAEQDALYVLPMEPISGRGAIEEDDLTSFICYPMPPSSDGGVFTQQN